MKKIFVITLVCASVFSCQKNDAVIATEPSLTDPAEMKNVLVNTDWILKHTALIYSPDLADNSAPEYCKRDDTYQFRINGDAVIEFGPVDCFMAVSSGSYGSWELQGAVLKQIIHRDVPGFIKGETIYWTVDYISSQQLRIKRTVTEPGKNFVQLDTYTRK